VRTVQQRVGGVVAFLTGAEGDVGPLVEAPPVYNPLEAASQAESAVDEAAFARVEALGGALGAEALRVFDTLTFDGRT